MRQPSSIVIILVALVASGFAAAEPAESEPLFETDVCDDPKLLPGLGYVCATPDQGYAMLSSQNGAFLGHTHGLDVVAVDEEDLFTTSSLERIPLACVTGAYGTNYEARLIYAFAKDDTDRYATVAPEMARLAELANGHVVRAGIDTGVETKIRVACDSNGDYIVERLPLPRSKSVYNTLSNVIDDVMAAYTSPLVKHWVLYDHMQNPNVCRGLGHLARDTRPGPENLNNGNSIPMVAVMEACLPSDGLWSDEGPTRVFLHELMHNMGAVQINSPNSDGAGHCTDNLDIMCSGARQVCPRMVLDCGKNDYFHGSPAANSYLAKNWNIGSPVNRFIEFGGPTPPDVSVPAIELRHPAPGGLYFGCARSTSSLTQESIILVSGCLEFTVKDDGFYDSGIKRIRVTLDTHVVYDQIFSIGERVVTHSGSFGTPAGNRERTLTLQATDIAGNTATSQVGVTVL